MEGRNRFKGLDMIDREPEELWMEVHDIVQEAVINTILKKRNAKIKKPFLILHYSTLNSTVGPAMPLLSEYTLSSTEQ